MTTILKVEELTKHFPIRGSHAVVAAVNSVNFFIAKGETLALVGESGSGKTTVGRCVLRLIESTHGKIFFHGQDISSIGAKKLRLLRSQMQLVFQDPYDSLNPKMSVGAIIEEPFFLHNKNSNSTDRKKKVEEIAQLVHLEPIDLIRFPSELSGGQQQRVGIARAIALNPDLIVLDEPTSSLDAGARAKVLKVLMEIQRKVGIAYLFISHDLTVVRHISDRLAIMYLGEIVETGTTKLIFDNPIHPYTRALLSSVPYPDPKIKLSRFYLSGEIPSPINLPSGCYLHSRCSEAIERCKIEHPILQSMQDGREIACFRSEELQNLSTVMEGRPKQIGL
jgi:oligopeptide transport system ATP-binding protein